jgi:arsenate reductase (thioredoxin)
MKFFSKSKKSNQQYKQILFVCVENAGRSQMAEGFFKKYVVGGYDAISAGTRPVSIVNPIAIEVMKEVGIDISNQRPKILTEDTIKNSSIRVNMGCIEKGSCPTLFINNVLDWNIEDPKDKPIEKVREIRDIIEERVRELVSNLSQTNMQINS